MVNKNAVIGRPNPIALRNRMINAKKLLGRVYLKENGVELRVNGILLKKENTTGPIIAASWVIKDEIKEDAYGRYRPAENDG